MIAVDIRAEGPGEQGESGKVFEAVAGDRWRQWLGTGRTGPR